MKIYSTFFILHKYRVVDVLMSNDMLNTEISRLSIMFENRKKIENK